MPSKALLASSDALADAREARALGIELERSAWICRSLQIASASWCEASPITGSRESRSLRSISGRRVFSRPGDLGRRESLPGSLEVHHRHGKPDTAERVSGPCPDRLHRQRWGARSRTHSRFGRGARRRLYRLRVRSVPSPHGGEDDDPHSQRTPADPQRRRHRGCAHAVFSGRRHRGDRAFVAAERAAPR